MKLHLGCWHRNIPGFINIDLCDLPHMDKEKGIHISLNIEAKKIE